MSRKYKYFIDLHVHTNRYSPCAELFDPESLLSIDEHKVHGLVITEHDTMWGKDEIANLDDRLENLKLYCGIEVSSSCGHFIVIGLDDCQKLKKGISLERLLKITASKGAVAILAHYHYPVNGSVLDINTIPPGVDAIEVASTITSSEQRKQTLQIARERNYVPVAGSDAHCLERVGEFFTVFSEMPPDEMSLAAAIREKRCVPGGFEIDQ